MIYKFIDDNDSEITVNSLSSLQSLVDSETIKEETKVKAGLRGKWTSASKIKELVFPKDEIQETEEPKEDIKSFITKEEPKEEVIETSKEEVIETQKKEAIETPKEEVKTNEQQYESSVDTSDYYTDVFMKKDNNEEEADKDEIVNEDELVEEKDQSDIEELDEEDKIDSSMKRKKRSKKNKYSDDNVIGLSFFQSVGVCLRKYFVFNGRASRSEYWFFQLLYLIISIPSFLFENSTNDTYVFILLVSYVFILLLLIPAFAVGVRRFHDVNKSGWFVLINFIPFIGWIIVTVMLVKKGTEGKNRFGNYPLKFKKNS